MNPLPVVLALCVLAAPAFASSPIPDRSYRQEFHEAAPLPTPAEKQQVASLVDRIVGGFVGHGFVLRDIDTTATRWGNGSPESLAHLRGACHVTGKARYRDAARRLVERHGYARSRMNLRYGTPSEQTHINHELLSMVFPNRFDHLVLPTLKAPALAAVRQWHAGCAADRIPFYDFVAARYAGRPVALEGAVETLRTWPLDMVEWAVDNSRREDGRLTRILPRDEMGLCMWDQEPHRAVIGRGGDREDKPTDWLLTYWMGRYWKLLGR